MLIPMDRPMIDARNIREWQLYDLNGNNSNYTIEHNNKAVVYFLLDNEANVDTDSTTAIADGVRNGQELTILVNVAGTSGDYAWFKLRNSANTVLKGDFYVSEGNGSSLTAIKLIWNSVDWVEVMRTPGVGESASGKNSYAEGVGTTASGEGAHAEGNSTTASGAGSHAEGSDTTASNTGAHAECYQSEASGIGSHAEGSSTASGTYSHAEGKNSEAAGESSHVMGEDAYAGQKFQYAHGGDSFSADGDAQYSRFICRESVTHSDANWYTIGIDDLGVGSVIPADSAWTFEAQVVGTTVDMGKVFGYTVSGVLINTAGTVTLQPSDPIAATVLYESDSDFDCQAVADDTNDALAIQVKDATSGSDTVRWVATIKLTQITFT